jgi:hypothetical protein
MPPKQSHKAVAIEELKPVLHPSAKRVKLTYGPYKIKGREVVTPEILAAILM